MGSTGGIPEALKVNKSMWWVLLHGVVVYLKCVVRLILRLQKVKDF